MAVTRYKGQWEGSHYYAYVNGHLSKSSHKEPYTGSFTPFSI